tara:strand:+ start:1435 stop:1614 length:180 start_codon:yes stop_codon:yes gene_type:complete
MNIIKVQYTKKENGSNQENNFKITFNNNTITFVGKNEGTVISNILDKWVEDGNTIQEAD